MLARIDVEKEVQNKEDTNFKFSGLLKRAVYGIGLNIQAHIITTQKELAILRHCASLLINYPNHNVHIVSARKTVQVGYFFTTLIHLGVSSGRIKFCEFEKSDNVPAGLWLLVAEDNVA